MRITALTLLVLLFFGCTKSGSDKQLIAKVVGNNLDCGKPMMTFDDSTYIRQLTKSSFYTTMIVNLPDSDTAIGGLFFVKVAIPTSQEASFACTTFGPAFPLLKLTFITPVTPDNQ